MRVLVCGGRNFADRRLVNQTLTRLHKGPRGPIDVIIQGGATGADSYARNWARGHGLRVATWEADWRHHGKAAGPMRNAQMLAQGIPQLVVAFPGGRGTADMVNRARVAGVEVMEIV